MKTIFLKTFGDTAILRIIDFLIVNDDFDYSMRVMQNIQVWDIQH